MKLRFLLVSLLVSLPLGASCTFIVGGGVDAWVQNEAANIPSFYGQEIHLNDFVVVQGVRPSDERTAQYYLGRVVQVFSVTRRSPFRRYKVSFVARSQQNRCELCSGPPKQLADRIGLAQQLVRERMYSETQLFRLPDLSGYNRRPEYCPNCVRLEPEPSYYEPQSTFLLHQASVPESWDDDALDAEGFPVVLFDEHGEPIPPDNFVNF